MNNNIYSLPRDGRSGNVITTHLEQPPPMANRAPDPLHANFLKKIRNDNAKEHNLVRFEVDDVKSNNISSIIRFGF
jgi:hypothetical protein